MMGAIGPPGHPVGGILGFVFILLILFVLLSGGIKYGCQADDDGLPRLAGRLAAVVTVLLVFLAIATPR
jgi:ABC-type transport system involved in multi-copper enzyme maturation permease subunit